MGFGHDLWNKLGEITERTDEGLKGLTETHEFISDLAKLEGKFGKDLQALCRKTHKACFSKKKGEVGSNRDAWAAFLREMDAVAVHYMNSANLINDTVVGPMSNFIKEKTALRKTYLSEAARMQKDLDNGYRQLSNVRKTYQKLCKDAEKAQLDFERADADPNYSVLQVEKVQSKSVSATQKARASDEEYANTVEMTNRLQREHFGSLFPRVLDDLQELDTSRIEQGKKFLQQTCQIHHDMLPSVTQNLNNIAESLNLIDSRADIDLFINANISSETPPDDIQYVPEPFIGPNGSQNLVSSSPGGSRPGRGGSLLEKDPNNMDSKELQAAYDTCKKEILVHQKTKAGIETLVGCYGEGSEAQRQVMGQIEDEDRSIANLQQKLSVIEALMGMPSGGGGDQWSANAGGSGGGGYDAYGGGGGATRYDASGQPICPFQAVAVYPYAAAGPGELSFDENAVIQIIQVDQSGWWRGVLNGAEGLAPSNYLQPR